MTESSTQSDWDFYFCNVNGVLSSIMVNLEANLRAPVAHKPWLLWLWVRMQCPRDDGLSSDKESPRLLEIEDLLTGSLSKWDAEFVGRITGGGRREFYLYSPGSDGLAAAVQSMRELFPHYLVESGTRYDADWRQYRDVLYPSDVDMQRIQNRRVLDNLEKYGDDHSIARPVDHTVYFRTADDLREFAAAAVNAGFAVNGEGSHDTDDADRPYFLNIVRTDPVTREHIDQVVLQLFDLAKQWHADYDGWGCEVQTAAATNGLVSS